jgi:Uri superfamily endonuclease
MMDKISTLMTDLPFDNSGRYLFVFELSSIVHVSIGSLGRHSFEPGWYVYTGSAEVGLRQRIARHVRRKKPARWHLDYVTRRKEAVPGGVFYVADPDITECMLNQAVGRQLGLVAPVAGFGASDCLSGCPAHLWFSSRPTLLADLSKLVLRCRNDTVRSLQK